MPPSRAGAPTDASARLIAATRELLGERRPGEITVRTIADRAGVQHSLITRHFGSRDGLFAATVAQVLGGVAQTIDAATDIDAAIDAAIDVFGSNPTLASAVSVLLAQGTAPAIGRYPIVDTVEHKLLRAGALPPQARETALMMTVTITGWIAAQQWWLDVAGEDDLAAGRAILRRAMQALVADALDPSR